MKKLKIALFSLAIVLVTFNSCTNNEPVVEEQQIEESESITTALNELESRFAEDGSIAPTMNPAGNIVFDFCFDFVYPIDLSYNNGVSVTVNSLDELVALLLDFTNDSYITGIAFPFDVEIFNDDTDAIEIATINNEEEFADLLLDCDFSVTTTCDCNEDYDPVCVEIEDPNGVSFTLTYPNACYAECDGFTEEDFIDDCEEDYNGNGGFECFEFNYPITIITDSGESVTVNSDEELNNVLYNSYYFEFEYPFSVTTDEDEVETIEDEEDFFELLEDCYDDSYPNECDCEEDDTEYDPVCVEVEEGGQVYIIVFPNECYAECEGFDEDDFVDCEDNGGCDDCTDEFDPVCVEIETPIGEEIITFPNECYAFCEGFDEDDFIDCDDDGGSECSEEDYFENIVECSWVVVVTNSQNEVYFFTFFEDDTVVITNEDESYTTTGEWEIEMNPSTDGYELIVTEEMGDFDSTWQLYDCDTEFLVSNNQTYFATQECDD